MAQIDELIAAMMERRANALILHSYQPARLDFGGVLASGAIVAPQLLRTMLREIVPEAYRDRLRGAEPFEFSHACASGLMKVQVERHGLDFHVVVTPYSSSKVFVPPADAKPVYQTYQPPVDWSLAMPGYPTTPIVSGAHNAQPANFPAPLVRAPVVKTKSKMGVGTVLVAAIWFCCALLVLVGLLCIGSLFSQLWRF